MFANGASPYGALHMAGNVWEWVDDRQTPSVDAIKIFSTLMKPAPIPTEPWYAIKGGSFRRPIDQAVTDDSASTPARYAFDDIGFRCVKDPAR
jgi:serine/threonine-protein kinase